MTPQAALPAYYAQRAAEYEAVYAKPERQSDLATIRTAVSDYFRERHVLEIACGTGYWTAHYAAVATAVLATDIGPEVLEVARAKPLPQTRVTFAVADAYTVDEVAGDFDACFAGFWWSHVPLTRLDGFLATLHRRLGLDARVMFVDNRHVEGSSTPIGRRDSEGNTYQRRQLANGLVHEVLKNFPSPEDVQQRLSEAGAADVTVGVLPYFWYATYHVQRIA